MSVVIRPYISLASGGGGLDLGVERGSGGTARPVCYVENEATAAALLVHRMETAHLPPAPLWSDLRTFDFGTWRGRVDGLVGGYPCQPFSYAGARRGEDDPRHLWPHIADGIRALEPRWCFFENVAGHLSMGGHEVARDLQGMGYTVAKALVTAEEVGAPHRRERIFILAYSDGLRSSGETAGAGEARHRGEAVGHPERPSADVRPEGGRPRGADSEPSSQLAGAHGSGGGSEHGLEHQTRPEVSPGAGAVGDASCLGRRSEGDERLVAAGADRRGGGVCWPPRPGDDWSTVPERLWPATVESDVRGGATGLADRLDLSRSDRLRILGNGVVPQQAAYAWRLLWEAMSEPIETTEAADAEAGDTASHRG